MTVFLVRHGLPLKEPDKTPAEWSLDPAGFDAIWALRESGRLPARAAWFSSPEPKATETAQLLTDGQVGIVDELAEQRRETTDHITDFAATVRRAFAAPEEPAHQGWEPLADCRDRVVTAARRIVEVHDGEDVVLIGHGTAWTLVAAALTGEDPDLDRWASLAMPDVITI
ncbi:broad specificity phosphatase PhoE [Nocardioides daedukensis]|uniref:Broad specificity phosphatase PhoE n=1 Tax=Nocardioides daedukensis TaxID=634462 RepID=A0A7Y9UTG2_9ACTN|nr:histidine phosphatase family protein [Nocardioides daedukensis]NYG58124.1 broad specificity phosphatase PhoE [Nocardioides daedukensis]